MDTSAGVQAYVAALGVTAAASLLLGAFVMARARALPGGVLLASFLAGVAAWSIGQALPALLGPAAAPVTGTLMALSPLPGAAFVHLVFTFSLSPATGRVASGAYVVATFAALVGLLFGVGRVVPWLDFPGMFVPSPVGWGVLGLTAMLSLMGHGRLALAWREQSGARRRQAGAVFASSFIGLVALTGFAFPALGIDIYPWPVLLLPLYSAVLTYGILRHRFMAANLWAQRALVSLLLVALAGLVSAAVAALPLYAFGQPTGFSGTWLAMTAGLLVGLMVLAPLRRLADSLVFPGGRVSDDDIARWRDTLAAAPDRAVLECTANAILSRRLALSGEAERPSLVVEGHAVRLTGWDDAPAATRHVAERFAGLVGEAAQRLSAAEQRLEAERARQQEARLSELGQLAATVAHDLRNPLGIIRMAAVAAPVEVRAEIGEQVARMDHLVGDILDYARVWAVERQPVVLDDLVGQMVCHPGVETAIPDGMMLHVDRRAMARVLANLIDNAKAMGTRVAVIAEAGPPAIVDVCDDGPGIAEGLAASLFRPFVSHRPEGTGLGLAIVSRIMEAHGGSVTLVRRQGWTTCFRLTFGEEP